MSQPQDFNIFKIYSKVAEDLQNANPIISYYLKTYTLNKALEYLKTERSQGKDVSDRTQEIKVWLQDLETLKGRLDNQLGDKEHCKQLFKDFTHNLFQKSNYDYTNANYTRTLARDFLYVSVLYDAWELLGAQTEETKEKKNYSNQARFKIMEALTNGTKPMPIPQPVSNQNQAQPTQPSQPMIQEKKEPDNLGKHDGPVDPMAKINFDLTESIVIPQTSIDKFLNTNSKKQETQPPNANDTHLNPNQLNPNPPNKWGIPVGKSMTIDETAPDPNQHQHQQQQIPHYDPQYHHPPLTRQKTPPTVFYAPRQTPSLHQHNFEQKPHVPNPQPETREDNLKHYILETPGGPSSHDHLDPKIDTPEENVKHYVLETPGGPDESDLNIENSQNISKVSEKIPEAKIEEAHHDNFQNQQNISKASHHDNSNPSQYQGENLLNLSKTSYHNNLLPHHGENFQNLSRISEGPSQNESTKIEAAPENQSQHFSSVLHESHIASHRGDDGDDIADPEPAILPNAKPAQSIIPQSQNLESIKFDVQNKSIVQENPSQLPSNPQSVFNPSASILQSKIPESGQSNGEHENLDPNTHQSEVRDSTLSKIDKVVKCKGAKDICLKAIIDLNTTNVKEARQKLQQALQILNEME